ARDRAAGGALRPLAGGLLGWSHGRGAVGPSAVLHEHAALHLGPGGGHEKKERRDGEHDGQGVERRALHGWGVIGMGAKVGALIGLSTLRNGCRRAPSPTNCIVAHTPFMMPNLQPVPSLHLCCTRFATPPDKSTRKEGHMHRFLLVVAAGLFVSCRDSAQPTVPAEVAATAAPS